MEAILQQRQGRDIRIPVLLQTEGKTEIRAITVNENDIPSVVSSSVYTIEFPIEDAPAVTPSTGQYTEPHRSRSQFRKDTRRTIRQTARRRIRNHRPTRKYTRPVNMPENAQTIFNAILVNDQNGKATEVTTRNYITTSN